jgi:hypothetical protein
MWSFKSRALNESTQKITLYNWGRQPTYGDVISFWKSNAGFRKFYFSVLQRSPFNAFFWENPPITKATLKQPYEFVLVNSPQLSKIAADSSPFQDRFNPNQSDESVATFGNLGRDAELIVPYPIAPYRIYTHFASFIRNAPEDQKHDLFISLANALMDNINDKPLWVSTSGLGVYWLHIRLDVRPKYYTHEPYRKFAE